MKRKKELTYNFLMLIDRGKKGHEPPLYFSGSTQTIRGPTLTFTLRGETRRKRLQTTRARPSTKDYFTTGAFVYLERERILRLREKDKKKEITKKRKTKEGKGYRQQELILREEISGGEAESDETYTRKRDLY